MGTSLNASQLKGAVDVSHMPAVEEPAAEVAPATEPAEEPAASSESPQKAAPDVWAVPVEGEEELPIEPQVLGRIIDKLPESVANCLKMCLRNVVGFDFFAATFDNLKRIALEELDASECEAACKLAIQALRAQAFKGVDQETLELMQLEAESLAVDLNSVHGFDLQGILLSEAQKSSVEKLAVGRRRQAAGTRLVDALSQAYWDATTRLIDVLTEVVNVKSRAEYAEEFKAWNEDEEELRTALKEAQELKSGATKAYLDASRNGAELTGQCDAVDGVINDVECYDAKIEVQGKTIESLSAKLAENESELGELKPWSFIRKTELRKETEAQRESLEQAKREKTKLDGLRASRILSLERGAMTLEELRVLKGSLETELKQADEKTNELRDKLNAAKEAAEQARGALDEHAKLKPEEASCAHKNLKQLNWRPVFRAPKRARGASKTSSYFKSGVSSWRNRRPNFTDYNPIHMSSTSSWSGFRGTIGYSWTVDECNVDYRLDLDISGQSASFDAVNEFLHDATAALTNGTTFGRFSFLKELKGRKLPFTSIGTALTVPKVDSDNVVDVIRTLEAVIDQCPDLAIDGVLEMAQSYAGIRNVYYVTSRRGVKELNLKQEVEHG